MALWIRGFCTHEFNPTWIENIWEDSHVAADNVCCVVRPTEAAGCVCTEHTQAFFLSPFPKQFPVTTTYTAFTLSEAWQATRGDLKSAGGCAGAARQHYSTLGEGQSTRGFQDLRGVLEPIPRGCRGTAVMTCLPLPISLSLNSQFKANAWSQRLDVPGQGFSWRGLKSVLPS